MLLIIKLFQLKERETTFRLHMDHRWGIPTLDQDFYERFHVFNSSRSSFPRTGRVDRDKWQPTLKVYQRLKEVDSKAQALIWHSLDYNGLSWNII